MANKVGLTDARINGLKAPATGLQRLGIPLVVSEAVLNHQSGSAMAGVAGVYHRHQYTNEKREALALWGREVLQIAAKYPPQRDQAA